MPPQENQNKDQFNQTHQAPLEPAKIPEPKSNKAVVVVLTVLIVVLLGVVAYLLLTKKDSQQNSIAKENALVEDNTSVSSDWKTYKNDEYGFEFKYPSDLTILDKSYVTPGGSVFPSLMVTLPDEEKDEQFITIRSKVSSSTAPETSCSSEFIRCKEFGSNIIYTKSPSEPILGVFDVIASTFKTSVSQDGIDSWQTYKNEYYGFKLKYPYTLSERKTPSAEFELVAKSVEPSLEIELFVNRDGIGFSGWNVYKSEDVNVFNIDTKVSYAKHDEDPEDHLFMTIFDKDGRQYFITSRVYGNNVTEEEKVFKLFVESIEPLVMP